MAKVLAYISLGFFRYHLPVVFASCKESISKVIGGFYCFSPEIIGESTVNEHCVFHIIMVFYCCSARPFFLYMYGTAYLIAIPYFLQKLRSLTKMNSLPPSAHNVFIKQPDLASTFSSQTWKASINLSFPQRYKVQVFWVCLHMRIAKYIFPEREEGLYDLYKLACISSRLFVMEVMLLFHLRTQVDLLSTHGIHSLLRLLGLSALLSWQTAIIGIVSEGVGSLAVGVLLSESKSKMSELSESISTLAGTYLLLEMSRLISSINLDALTTRVLLACPNL